jgi:hypothetical protein
MRQQGEHSPVLTWEEIKRQIETGRLPTPQQQADNLIRWLGDNAVPGEKATISDREHGGIIGAALHDGFEFIVSALLTQGWIQSPWGHSKTRSFWGALSFPGWSRYGELRRGHIASHVAFMAMPFGDTGLDSVVDDCFKRSAASAIASLSHNTA